MSKDKTWVDVSTATDSEPATEDVERARRRSEGRDGEQGPDWLARDIDPDTALSSDKPAHNLDKSNDPSWSGQGHGKGHVTEAD